VIVPPTVAPSMMMPVGVVLPVALMTPPLKTLPLILVVGPR
jgi:hypothetical protein